MGPAECSSSATQLDFKTSADRRRQLSFGAEFGTEGQQILTQRGTRFLPLTMRVIAALDRLLSFR
jgi:hypothetical protein